MVSHFVTDEYIHSDKRQTPLFLVGFILTIHMFSAHITHTIIILEQRTDKEGQYQMTFGIRSVLHLYLHIIAEIVISYFEK